MPGFIDEMKNHYKMLLPTLFGIDKTHDMHAGRKGSYNDIIEASKKCVEEGIEVIWKILWSKLNTDEINDLYELGKSMGINKVVILGEYIYSGYFPKHADKYLPVLNDLHKIKYEIEEHKQGLLKTQKQFVEDIKNGIVYDVKKVSFEQIAVDEDYNVYPLGNDFEQFYLGNLNETPDKIMEQIKNGIGLPEAIINKRKQDFSELVLQYADVNSNQLFTPQALFDKLCNTNRQRISL